MRDELLIYGATGYTGTLLARAAQQEGLAPIVCGRSEDKVRRLAEELGVDWRVAGLDQPGRLDRALDGVGAVLNAAGPFSQTTAALVEACLRTKTHYLDVTGEAAVIESVSHRDAEARRGDVMLMPSVGFDVVPSDCLVAHAVRRARAPRSLSIGLSGLRLLSRGSAATYIEHLGDPVWVRRGGTMSRVPEGSLKRAFDYGRGPSTSIVVSWGDVASAYYTTGVPDVTVYFEATPPVRVHKTLLELFGWAVPMTPWRAMLLASTQWMPHGPSEEERALCGAVVAVDVEDADGTVHHARLRTPEAYTFTAIAAIAIARRVTSGDWEPGFQTPARVYGPDFVMTLPGVTREDL